MKTKVISSLTLSTLLLISPTSFAKAKQNTISDDYIKNIEQQVIFLEDGIDSFEIKNSLYLYDINNQPNYVLSITDNNGYIISGLKNEAISEYSLTENSNPYMNMDSDKLYYYGPMNYLENFMSFYQNNNDNIGILKELNEKFLNSVKPISIKSKATSSWIGATESRFSRYNSDAWINKTDICGPVSAAIMLAYYEDYLGYNLVPDNIRKKNSASPGSLISKLKAETPNPTSTIPSTVASGVNGFIQKYSPDKYKKATYVLSYQFASIKGACNKKHPICVGLLKSLGSTYGNHWVTAYQVRETAPNTGMIKCVDNHGNYRKQISTTWTMGSVNITP